MFLESWLLFIGATYGGGDGRNPPPANLGGGGNMSSLPTKLDIIANIFLYVNSL